MINYDKELLSAMKDNDFLETAIHLLYESKCRLELTTKFNNINAVDERYCHKTIDKINKFLGEDDV